MEGRTERGPAVRRLAGALLALLLPAAVVLGLAAADLWRQVHRPLALGARPVVVELPRGSSLQDLAGRLQALGVLERPRALVWWGRWRGLAGRLQAGEYLLRPGTSAAAFLEQVAAGRVRLHRLTLVEGWTFAQALAAVEAHPALRHTLRGLPPEAVMARLGHPGQHPEGRFLPDTYRFPKGTTDLAFLERAYRAMERFLARAWAERAPGLPYRSPYEALILASIVEKETALPAERPLVAGVLVRRLQRGMRLQADPTVIYGLGARFDGDLRRRDLLRDGPYNTYRRKGLPPTPIALPGRAAILAALHPAPGEALYYVARGDGSHVFSATLAEHRAAVRRYQLRT
ncbi:MAG: endolytic transglycosylase MltG, partial [Gammaproteobacteria bacterium]